MNCLILCQWKEVKYGRIQLRIIEGIGEITNHKDAFVLYITTSSSDNGSRDEHATLHRDVAHLAVFRIVSPVPIRNMCAIAYAGNRVTTNTLQIMTDSRVATESKTVWNEVRELRPANQGVNDSSTQRGYGGFCNP